MRSHCVRKKVALSVLASYLLGTSAQAELCRSRQIDLAADLAKAEFACQRNYVRSLVASSAESLRSLCLDSARSGFVSRFDPLVAADSACTLKNPGNEVHAVWSGEIATVADPFLAAWTASAPSPDANRFPPQLRNRRYATMLRALSIAMNKALKIETDFARSAGLTEAARSTQRNKAGAQLARRLKNLAAAPGLGYAGPGAEALAAGMNLAVDRIVALAMSSGLAAPAPLALRILDGGDGVNAAEAALGVPVEVDLPQNLANGYSLEVVWGGLAPVLVPLGTSDVQARLGVATIPAAGIYAAGNGQITVSAHLVASGAGFRGPSLSSATLVDFLAPASPLLSIPAAETRPWRAIRAFAGGDRSCVRLENGETKCWGGNAGGQLGLEDAFDRGDKAGDMGDPLPAIALGSGLQAAELAPGGSHTCALLGDGQVKCWGANAAGQLGLGDTRERGGHPGDMGDPLDGLDFGTLFMTPSPGYARIAVQLAAGAAHSCARFNDGGVKCWGRNTHGELGLGDTANRGDSLAGIGDALPALDLGGAGVVAGLSAGSGHTCALLEQGTIRCWGDNAFGQLGLGDTLNRGDQPGEMGTALPAVEPGTIGPIAAILAGGSHSCAYSRTGAMQCWGANGSGQLGVGDTEPRGDAPGEMGDQSLPVDLGESHQVVEAKAGDKHTCARLEDATVKCWGENSDGRLGLEDTDNRGDQPGEMGNRLPAVRLGQGRAAVELAVGGEHACVRLDDGTVKCWGNNGAGRLGLGDGLHRGGQPGQMGDALPAVDLGAVPAGGGDGLLGLREAAAGVAVRMVLPPGLEPGDVLHLQWGSSDPVPQVLAAEAIAGGGVEAVVPAASVSAQGDGSITVSTWISDAMGNQGGVAIAVVRQDFTAPGQPQLLVPAAADGRISAEEIGTEGISVTVKLPPADASVAVQDGIQVHLHWGRESLQPHPVSAEEAANGVATLQVPYEVLYKAGDGLLTVVASLTDAAGNAGPATVSALTAALNGEPSQVP